MRGDASRSIAGFPLTNANYLRSIELLQERFGQRHRIVNAHMEAMINLPNPTSQLASLQHFYDTLETHIRGLEALGKSHESYGGILVPIIQKKLPVELKKNLARDHSNKERTLDEIREAILKEVEKLEAGQSDSKFPELPSSNLTIPTASFVMSSNQRTPPQPNGKRPPPKQRSCAYCKGNHNPLECTVVKEPSRINAIIQEARLCFNCLGRHQVTGCQSRNRCRQCHRKHHTSLRLGASQSASPLPVANNVVTDQQVIEGDSTVPAVAALHAMPKNDSQHKPTLLKTAIAPVEHRGRRVRAHILFDEGSQRSFVTDDLAKQLQLIPSKAETISLSVWRHIIICETSRDRLHQPSTDDGKPIPLEVIIIRTIAAPVQNHMSIDLQDLPHLQGLKLAHPILKEDLFQIDLLIGADHYLNIVEDQIIRGCGPTAAKSKIGYLLSGLVSNTNQSTMVRTSILHVMTANKQDQFQLERFWNLKSVDILMSTG